MLVNVEELSPVKKKLHIEVPEAQVTRLLDDAYRQMNKTAKVKGFRQGKVPRSVLERLYKKDIENDVVSQMIQESFSEAMIESKLQVLGQPAIDPPAIEPEKPYRYEAMVEISPEIGEIDFKDLELKKNMYKVSDEEIDTQLKMLQRSLADLKPVDVVRPAKDGDVVLIDFEGYVDGKPFEETPKTENFKVRIGAKQITEDFEENILEMLPGESKSFKTAFSEEYPNRKMAGKVVEFHITLNEIREEILPPLDDDFAKKLGQFQTLDEVKQQLFDHLNQGYEKRKNQELVEQIFQKLLEKTEFEVPDILVQYELAGILSEIERTYAKHGTTMEQLNVTHEQLAVRYRETAVNQAKRSLLLRRIIEQENLEITREELDAELARMAVSMNQPVDAVKEYYNEHPEGLDHFKNSLLEKKAIDIILNLSKVEEVEPETDTPEPPEQDVDTEQKESESV